MKKALVLLLATSMCAMLVTSVLVRAQTPVATVRPQGKPDSAERGAKYRRAPAEKRVPDQYIVVLNDDVQDVEEEAARLVVEHGGSRHQQHTYRRAVKGFSVWMPEAQARKLAEDVRVAYVEEDQVVTLSASQSNAMWGLDRIDQRDQPLDSAYTYNLTGSGVKAYILDTGVLASHSEFGGRVVAGYTAINDGRGTTDCNGHGTHVAGTVGGATYGVAKSVTIVPVRVLDCAGSGTVSGVIAGVDWVTSDHVAGAPAVANMSLGGAVSSSLDTAVNNSINDGVTYAIAAGNDGLDACNYSPARVTNAITVGATNSSDARDWYSNFGTCVDIFAPGSSITSAWHTSSTATNTISGTSMATPHVAGVAALYLHSNPSASPATVWAVMRDSATLNKVADAGAGSPNRLIYSLLTASGGGDGTVSCVTPPAGLLSWWPGDSNANDMISNNHGLLLNGASLAQGKVDQSFNFDGADDALSLNTSALKNPFTGMSVEAWVLPLSHGKDTIAGVGLYGKTIISNTDGDGFAVRVKDGFIQVDMRTTGGNVLQTFGGAQVPLNQWSHVAVTFGGGAIKAYLNGALVGSVPASGTMKNSQNASTCTMIGNEPAGCVVQSSGFGWPGRIDELGIFNRALTQTEIQAIFNAGSAGKCKTSSIQFSAAEYSVNENNGGATVTVARTSGVGTASINYATSNGTATAGTDYTATSGTLNFAAGETSKTFTVPILDDSVFEGNETINLTLTNPAGGAALGSPSTATLTVVDNEQQPSLTINNVSLPEPISGTSLATFSVSLTNASAKTVTVNYATANGTATAGTAPGGGDYDATSGTLSFNPGETAAKSIQVVVNSDPVVEGDETFYVNLSGAQNATISKAQGVGTILSQQVASCLTSPAGTQAWWPGDGNGNDISGNNTHAALQNGTTFVTGKVAQAFSFNGASATLTLPAAALKTAYTAMTIDAWVYPLSHGKDTAYGGVYGRNIISNTDTDGFALRVRDGYLQVDARLTGGNILQTFNSGSQSQLPLNRWSHVAMTYDGSFIRVYLNGALVGSVAAKGTMKNSQNAGTCTMIGNEPAGCAVQSGGFSWHGYLDEVGVFTRALTQAEVQAIFNADSAGKCKP